jgi:hypothetical protein
MDWDPYWFHLGRDGFYAEVRKRSGEIFEKLGR